MKNLDDSYPQTTDSFFAQVLKHIYTSHALNTLAGLMAWNFGSILLGWSGELKRGYVDSYVRPDFYYVTLKSWGSSIPTWLTNHWKHCTFSAPPRWFLQRRVDKGGFLASNPRYSSRLVSSTPADAACRLTCKPGYLVWKRGKEIVEKY